jgi:MinD-like ATPase involved in chromosome partitioning or flagellar assembly
VIIDAGSGMNAWVDSLWHAARQVLLLATPENQSLLDGYAAVKLSQFQRLDGKVRLVLNRCRDAAAGVQQAHRFAETCRQFLSIKLQEAATLPSTSRRASTTGDSVADADDPFARAVRLLAADLAYSYRAVALRLLASSARRAPTKATATAAISPIVSGELLPSLPQFGDTKLV